MGNLTIFSEHLLQLRKARGLKQTEVAQGTHMSLRAYQNYEWGLREPKMTALLALAEFYNISVDELVCWRPKEE